jgi:hypothetical protein
MPSREWRAFLSKAAPYFSEDFLRVKVMMGIGYPIERRTGMVEVICGFSYNDFTA